MKQTYNSISEILKEFLRGNSNQLKILSGITDSFITEKDFISISIKDFDGNTIVYQIPSYSFIRKRLDGVDSNITQLYDIKNKEKYAPIFNENLQITSEPQIIEGLVSPSNFESEDNVRYLYNKNLYVNIDIANKVHPQTKTLLSKRLSLTVPEEKIEIWNSFSDQNNLEYDTVIDILTKNKISYTEKEQHHLLTPTILKYSGEFQIINIQPDIIENSVYSSVKKYLFTTVFYDDNFNDKKSTMKLKKDDKLITSDGYNEFIILEVEEKRDSSTLINQPATGGVSYYVTMAQITGYKVLQVGEDILKIVSPTLDNRKLKIPFGLNEKIILFVKQIDPYFNITTSKYSKGILIDTNKLYINTASGQKTLLEYYTDEVYDYSKYLEGKAKENPLTNFEAEDPDPPTLSEDNFKVVQINAQRQNQDESVIKDLLNQKKELETQESALRTAVSEAFSAKNNDPMNYEKKQTWYDLNSDLLEVTNAKYDIQNKINSYLNLSNVDIIDPKYQVKGFWNIPLPKKDSIGNLQNVIAFKILFRYLNIEGNPNAPTQLQYVDNDGQLKPASFSEWNEITTPVRPKVWNEQTGVYEWSLQNANDSNVINSNQVALPINSNEQLEIQVASISEAGFPDNPKISGFSNAIIVKFGNEISITNKDSRLLYQNVLEASVSDQISQTNSINLTLSERLNNLENIVLKQYDTFETVLLTTEILSNGYFYLKKVPLALSPVIIVDLYSGSMLSQTDDYTVSADKINLSSALIDTLIADQKLFVHYKSNTQF